MKKISPYMLVRSVEPDAAPPPTDVRAGSKARKPVQTSAAQTQRVVDRLLAAPALKKTFATLDPRLKQTLLGVYRDEPLPLQRAPAKPAAKPAGRSAAKKAAKKTAAKRTPAHGKGTTAVRAAPVAQNYLEQITRDLGRAAQVRRVGLLDLGALIAGLPELLVRLNAAQDRYTLFEINAPVPSGLRKTAQGMVDWMRAHHYTPTRTERKDLAPHIIADEYFSVAEDIRASLSLDLVVGLAAAMVAGLERGRPYWNHFSAVYGQAAVVSTTDLREYAQTAQRPYEVAIGVLLVGAVLVAFNSELDYHDDTGCIFDYNEMRVTLVNAIREPALCEACRALLPADQAAAADAMLAVLRRMKRKST